MPFARKVNFALLAVLATIMILLFAMNTACFGQSGAWNSDGSYDAFRAIELERQNRERQRRDMQDWAAEQNRLSETRRQTEAIERLNQNWRSKPNRNYR